MHASSTAIEALAWRGRRVLVLGASGFLGRRVAVQAAGLGAEVHAVVRDPARAARVLARAVGGVRIHAVDLSTRPTVAALLEGVGPEIVLDLTGYGVRRDELDPGSAELLNARLPEWIASSFPLDPDSDWTGAQIVRAGSALEVGETAGEIREADPCRPTTLYGRTKLAGTLALARASAAAGVRAITARLFNVYGPGEPPGRLFPSLVRAARRGGPLPLTLGVQRRDFTFVEDAAEGILRLAGSPAAPGEVVHLATGRLTSVREFALATARLLAIEEERLRFGELPAREDELDHGPVSIARLRVLCGWSPPSDLEDGLARALHAIELEERRPELADERSRP